MDGNRHRLQLSLFRFPKEWSSHGDMDDEPLVRNGVADQVRETTDCIPSAFLVYFRITGLEPDMICKKGEGHEFPRWTYRRSPIGNLKEVQCGINCCNLADWVTWDSKWLVC